MIDGTVIPAHIGIFFLLVAFLVASMVSIVAYANDNGHLAAVTARIAFVILVVAFMIFMAVSVYPL